MSSLNNISSSIKQGLTEAIEYISYTCKYSDRKTCYKCPLGHLNLCGTAPCSWDTEEINGLTDALIPLIQNLNQREGK